MKFEPVIVIPLVPPSPSDIETTVREALSLCPRVWVVMDRTGPAAGSVLEGSRVEVVCDSTLKGRGDAVLRSAARAQNRGATHIVTVAAGDAADRESIAAALGAALENPEDVILGWRRANSGLLPAGVRFRRAFAAFWLRLQTGLTLRDAGSPLRVYPLSVLQNLRLKERSWAFDMEVLVKSVWSGIAVREVALGGYRPPPPPSPRYPFQSLRENFRLTVLNIHWAMRAITPIPHRKIIPDPSDPARKVSVLRPLKSLKQLLTENARPARLAAAVAAGVFLGTLPLIALHSVAILFAANFFRFNKMVALSASQLCVPPVVPALCIEAGYFLRNGSFLTEISIETLGYQALDRLLEWFLGSLAMAPLLAAVAGGAVYFLALYLLRTQVQQVPASQGEPMGKDARNSGDTSPPSPVK